MNTHRHLDEELSTLRQLLIDMANFVDEQVGDAVIALGSCDAELAQGVRDRDDQIDEFERAVARNVERIADQAKNIAQGVIFLVEGINARHRPLLNSNQDLS